MNLFNKASIRLKNKTLNYLFQKFIRQTMCLSNDFLNNEIDAKSLLFFVALRLIDFESKLLKSINSYSFVDNNVS